MDNPKIEQMIKSHFGEDANVEEIIESLFKVVKDMLDFLMFIQMKQDYLDWVVDRDGYQIKHYTKQKIKPIYPEN